MGYNSNCCPDQQSYCSFTCCQKVECEYSTADSISLKKMHQTHKKKTNKPPQTKSPKQLEGITLKRAKQQ